MSSIVLWSIAFVIAALGLVASVQSWRFGRFVAQDAERLFALRGAGYPIHHLEALPPPVRRYAELVGATTHAPVRALRLRHAGTFRTALDRPPQPIRGEQYFSSDLPGFVWWGRIAMAPGLWVEARDACIGAEGTMLIRVESTYTLDDARGPGDGRRLAPATAERDGLVSDLAPRRALRDVVADRRSRGAGDPTAARPRGLGKLLLRRRRLVGAHVGRASAQRRHARAMAGRILRLSRGRRPPRPVRRERELGARRRAHRVRALGHGVVRIRPPRAVLTF